MTQTPDDPIKSANEEDLREILRPYGIELGYVAFSWNRLHDNLANLFEIIIQSPSKGIGTAIWYSTDSDFAQRKMLRSATEKALHIKKDRREAIIWLLNQVDDFLRHKRNDAMHSPVATAQGDFGEGETVWVIPDPGSGSPRAKSLWAKERTHVRLVEELKDYGEFANTLAIYSHAMFMTFVAGHPWPQKPKLPHAHRTKIRKGSSGQNNPK